MPIVIENPINEQDFMFFFFFYLLSKLWNIRHGIKEMENKRSGNEKEVFGFKIGIKKAYFCTFDK